MSLPTGTRLGIYEIVTPLGAGGMGEVYRARDSRLNRHVALKLVPAERIADLDRVRRFEQEARAASALNHPHIVSIHDIGESEGFRFIAMELVEGVSPIVWVEREKPELRRILEVVTQVADALTETHRAGIVHRDIKPANILVTPQGYAKVLDFGLAKLAEVSASTEETKSDAPALTERGAIVGTVAYMSPEQALSRPVDGRTDVFSLGAVLYEMVTGHRLFAGSSPIDVVHAVIHDAPGERLRPVELQWIADKALAKDTNERYQSMAEFAADLRRLRRRLESGLSSPQEALVEQRSPHARSLGWLWAAAGLLAGIIPWFVPAIRDRLVTIEPFLRAESRLTQLTSYTGTERAGAISPDGKYFAFVSEKGGAPDLWVRQVSGGEPVQLTHDDNVESDVVYAPDGESIYYSAQGAIWRIPALGGNARRVVSKAGFPAPSPDGKQLGYVRNLGADTPMAWENGAIEIAGADGSAPREIHRTRRIGQLAWSPDGRWLSFTEGQLYLAIQDLYLLDVKTRTKRKLTRVPGSIVSYAWLPDGCRLIVATQYVLPLMGASDLAVVSIDGHPPRRLTLNGSTRLTTPSVSANGSRLVVTMQMDEREIWKVPLGPDVEANGREANRLLDSSWNPFWAYVSHDGATLLFNSPATGKRNLWIMTLDGGAQPRQVTTLEGAMPTHASFSPDATRVAYVSLQSGSGDIWVANTDGSNPTQVTDKSSAPAFWPTWSPDGKWIAFGSGREGLPQIWKVPSAGGHAVRISEWGGRVDWSPVDNRLAYSDWLANRVEIVDADSSKVLLQVPIPQAPLSLPVWSPDGRQFSLVRSESYLKDSVWIYDAQTGQGKPVVQFPGRFHMIFRAGWSRDQKSLIVNRQETTSHIVLIENF